MPIPKKDKPRLKVSGKQLLAANVLRLRRMKQWTQEELSYEAGLHRTMVGQIERERRNVTLATMEALAAALEVDIEELLAISDADDMQLSATATP